MTPEYRIVPFESRPASAFFRLRFHWRIEEVQSGKVIQSSTSQSYTRRVDRDSTMRRFYERGCVPGVVEFAQ
jgi:hypothetical protein